MAKRKHDFTLLSTGYIIEDEVTGQKNRIKQLVGDITPKAAVENFDAFMVVSGNMKDTEAYWKNPVMLDYVREFNAAGKPLAAICCSVPTIREAARGKKVSFFPLVRSRHLLQSSGAILQTVALTRDQNLVTAEHQMASQVWGEEFCNLIEGRPQEHFFTDSKFVPGGRERKPIPEVERLKELQAKKGI